MGTQLGRLIWVGLVFALLGACAPVAAPVTQTGSAPAAPGLQRVQPKTLRMGMLAGSEPTGGIVIGGQTGTGPPEHGYMLHAGLTVYDGQSNLQPSIAVDVPTIERGDWQLFPDGRMDVTWKLRPNVRWHDGTPLSADDFVFGLQVLRDPDVSPSRSRAVGLIAGADALDESTLVVHWRQPFIQGNAAGVYDLPAVPRHLMAEPYATRKETVVNHPYWASQFVGLGPYRLDKWESGAQMQVVANDDYFLGRPRIDRIVIDYFGDVNGVVAGLLSGDIDVAPVGALKTTELVTLKNNWEARGAGDTLPAVSGTRNYRFQYRDPSAPWARDLRVRQALIHMLDRQAIVDSLVYGLSAPADTIASPGDPVYRLLEQRGFARYPYDLARAEALMAEAGYRRGSDGAYRGVGGDAFNLEVRTSSKTDNVTEGQALAGQWKDAGVTTSTFLMPDSAPTAVRNEMRGTFPGVLGWPFQRSPTVGEYFISSQIPTAENRWNGMNSGAFSNTTYDNLFERYLVTLETPRRQEIFADMLKIQADDAVAINLYYDFSTYIAAVRKGVRGPANVPDNQAVTSWNIATWEIN